MQDAAAVVQASRLVSFSLLRNHLPVSCMKLEDEWVCRRAMALLVPLTVCFACSLIGASIVFCLPMFTALLAVINQAVGDFWCTGGFVLLVFSLVVWLPFGDVKADPDDATGTTKNGVLEPQSHASASVEFQCRGYISLGAKILAVCCLAVFALRLRGDLDQDEKQQVNLFMKDNMAMMAATALLDCFGKAYIAFVFCADTTTGMISKMALSDEQDEVCATHDPAMLRREEMHDMASLMRAESIAASSNAPTRQVHPHGKP